MLSTYVRAKTLLSQIKSDESGASAAEYGLLLALVAVAIIVGATALGTSINGLFSGVATTIAGKPTA